MSHYEPEPDYSSNYMSNEHKPPVYDSKYMLDRYKKWLQKYERRYQGRYEREVRYGIYQSNVRYIDYINSQNLSYKLAENKYADMTNEEFQAIYLGYKGRGYSHYMGLAEPVNITEELPDDVDWRKEGAVTGVRDQAGCGRGYSHYMGLAEPVNITEELPDDVDWRKEGAVTGVRDQAGCGACWAFAAVAAIEGVNKISGGNLTTLSEQMLVDCDNNDNTGCHGGIMEKAYEFIIKNGGIATEDDYPYVGRDKICNKIKAKEVAVKIKEYKKVPENDEKSLQAAVAKQPVSVAIHSGFLFQFYSNGVFSGSCGTNVNHGVTVVGYGEERGRKYWIVKNSWGKDWGEDGYMKIKRGTKDKRGECGIATDCTYPVFS
ncbi:hypothetical protein CTI12_AA129810 [Artemisia annua]|uniref:Uncharacterized protein n=1 Tax=Artemisia annua TaxID=35608 RepID=A0A2U1PNW6_ARTAN|nr:hypothetical protein CTI12_AA129810 [Artemisia annua]